MPGGLPGSSMLFRVMTRTSSAPLPDKVVHVWAVEAPTPAQKLITILSANFSMLFLPSGLVITPPSPAGMLLAITLASLSHCLSKAETQRFAPKARPELTNALYTLWTARSSTSTCSTHVTLE
uniref:Uncharacterized protein n=1 Tax=Opuntia streptacantha TaxID=393608 RepID=A0A7C9AEL8_OPUST